jgi:hypothetical protein
MFAIKEKQMETIGKKREFIELRSKNWSIQKIADSMGLSKRALVTWNKEFSAEIQLKRQLELDNLRSLVHEAEDGRMAVVRAQWEKLREEVTRRNLKMLSTDKVLGHFIKLADVLKEDTSVEEQQMVELPNSPEREGLHQLLFDLPTDSIL